MGQIRSWFMRLAGLFGRDRRDRELAEELESHLQLHVNDNIARGMSPEAARRAALIKLGGVESIKESYRDRRGLPLLETLGQDLRYGLRTLLKAPGFTGVAVLTLALGIGANTAIFSVIEAVLLRPLPYRDPGRLIILTDPQDQADGGFLYKDLEAWRSTIQSLENIAFYYRDGGWSRVTLAANGEPESTQGGFVSADFFPMLGVSPSLGRTFTADEDLRREHVLILSHSLWTERFGGSRDVVGKTIQIDGADWQIIGVMPASFQAPSQSTRFWAPLRANRNWNDPALTASVDPNHNRYFFTRWQAMGRLRTGFTLAQAQAELSTTFERASSAEPDPNRGRGIAPVPLHVKVSGNTRLAFIVLFAAVSFVLLIACANVANLVLARGAARERELAVRSALGAGRGRLVRQLFTESALLALLAGGAGLALAQFGVRALVEFGPPDVPRLEQAGINLTVLAFTLAAAMLAATLFGFFPALRISRTDLNESLKSGMTRIAGSRRLRRTRGLLVAAEFVLAVVLLAGAGLLVRSYLAVTGLETGFQAKQILTMHVAPPAGATAARADALHERVLQLVRALPGVVMAGAIDGLFELGDLRSLGLRAVEGREPESRESWTPLTWQSVRGDYFQAMGAPLLKGRFFTEQDGPGSPLVAIVDEAMVRRYWPDEDPIGKRIKGQDHRGQNDDWVTIVGVVGDMRRNGLERQAMPHVYEWYPQAKSIQQDLVVRTSGDPRALAATLRGAVREVDDSAILSPATTMEQQLAEQQLPRRFQTWLLGIFSMIALVLATVGIYGVMHYSTRLFSELRKSGFA
jgi:predicted permease